jgi:U4/U6.U5 tri-snRNP-associated protein 1
MLVRALLLPSTTANPNLTEIFATSDYLQEGDVGFKKPKVRCFSFTSQLQLNISTQTKKKRSSRRAPDADAVPTDQMDVDQKPIVPLVRDLDANFVDDDDLQAALARSRKAKLRKATKMSPEELARKGRCFGFSWE